MKEPTKEEIEMKLEDFDRAMADHVNAIGEGMHLPKRNINLDQNQRAVCELIYLAEKEPISLLEISELTGLGMSKIMVAVEQLKDMNIEIREISSYGAISYFMPKHIKEFQAKTNCFGFRIQSIRNLP